MDDQPAFDHVTHHPAEREAIGRRWARQISRGQERWVYEQCGGCRFWIPLAGATGADWGACANAGSEFDGRVRFEHDGCDAHVAAGAWVTPEAVDDRA